MSEHLSDKVSWSQIADCAVAAIVVRESVSVLVHGLLIVNQHLCWDPDQFAFAVYRRPTAVAVYHSSIGLDPVGKLVSALDNASIDSDGRPASIGKPDNKKIFK